MYKRAVQNRKNVKKINPKIKNILLLEGTILLINIIAFTVTCALFFFCDIPLNSWYYVILVGLSLSAFLSGYITGKKMKKNGLVSGIIYNLFIVVLTLIISLILNGFAFDYRLFLTVAVMMIMSAVGGIAAVNSRRKTR